jgi:(E)-4-hydroxy-3-methylbut-2-enyl-diphosphate synthase
MTKTATRDVSSTVNEIRLLAQAGCEIIRLAVPDSSAAEALKEICRLSPIPVIADIHFDHQLALTAINNGVHALRLNPGNIRSEEKVREVIAAALDREIPLRVGVNAGSLDPDIKAKFGGVTAEGLAESALNEVKRLEKYGFGMIKIAVKAFDLQTMTEAVRIVADRCDYPLHLGVTESGLPEEGIIRSSIGIGNLLLSGIGDTIRVSLTSDSVTEIKTGIRILKILGLRQAGPTVVSCPTCGRCQIPLQEIARTVQQRLEGINESFQVAVMGCAVNGPGEAEQADFGIAGGRESGLIFRHGKIVRTLPADQLVDGLMEEIFRSLNNKR